MSPRVALEPGYLLGVRPYRDTSLLLEAFTASHGRVGLVARGARGPRSKLRGLLQLLQPLLLSWNQAGELGTLTGAEADGAPLALSGERVFYAWYVNELLLRLLQRQDPHPPLYRCYARTLAALGGAGAEAALRLFEKQLLAETGYGLDLPADLDPHGRYDYDAELGLLPSARADALAGESLIALRDEQLDAPRALADARTLLRAAIARQLGGRPLETPQLLRALRAGRGATHPDPE